MHSRVDLFTQIVDKNSKVKTNLGRIRVLLFAVLLIALAAPGLKSAHASYQWDESTKTVLSGTSQIGPALAYDPANGKVFMAWQEKSSCQCLRVISSSDMISWSSEVLTGFSAQDTGLIDLTYDSSNQKLYMAYELLQVIAQPPNGYWSWSMYVTSSSDGQTWSGPVLVNSGNAANLFWGGLSIAYNSGSNVLAVAETDGNNDVIVYSSTNGGVNWSNGQQVYYNNFPVQTLLPRIRFINGAYFLIYYSFSSLNIHILQSSDLSLWTNQSNPPHSGYADLAYDAADQLYHLNWRGTDSAHTINDAPSSDLVNWWTKVVLSEQSYDYTSLVYDPTYSSLLLAWTGTNGCFGTCGGNLNVMQYRNVACGCGGCGCGGGGSVASGSLITLSDGTRVPVQNIRVGTQVIVYNVPTGYQTIATVYQIRVVTVDNTLTIHTTAGIPFRADANPGMRLWVLTNGGAVEKPITTIQPGDQIYSYDLGHWVSVPNVTITYGGQHTMYDLLTNPNFTSNGLLLEYIANGYPDCPPQGCKV